MRLTEAELGSYRNTLEGLAARLEAGMRRLDRIAVETAPDEMENLQLAGARDIEITRLDREAALLAEVRTALDRIAEGSYGACLACGREIGRGRLNALPWASCCISCQEEIDRRRSWSDGDGAVA